MRTLSVVALGCLASLAACSASPVTEHGSIASEQRAADCRVLRDASQGHPQAYFSPFDPIEQQILCILGTAKREVVVANYNIHSDRIVKKLIELGTRTENRVNVRVVMDEDNAARPDNTGDDQLEAAGRSGGSIELVRTKPPAGNRDFSTIMHLKSMVVDETWVTTGSFNFSETASFTNDENFLVFKDEPGLARRYKAQVLQVLERGVAIAQGRAPGPQTVEEGAVDGFEVHYSPEEAIDKYITREIDRATQSIDIAMFAFNSKPVVEALARAMRERNVKVRMIVETKQASRLDGDDKVEAAGGQVFRFENKNAQYSAMHQKYGIFDKRRIITGASNWSHSGTRVNDEDIVIVENADVTLRYRKNFADLLKLYKELDTTGEDAALRSANSGVLFRVEKGGTQLGDRVVVVGDRAELGAWDPSNAIEAETAVVNFPTWTAKASLPAGTRVEYKYVLIKADGQVVWEAGPNRVLQIPATGRAVVINGEFDKTANNWTPADSQ